MFGHIQTSTLTVNEIQSLMASADHGQTFNGGMRLHFNGYTTPLLLHDIKASKLKRRIEDSLNPAKRNQLTSFDCTDPIAGIGIVNVMREFLAAVVVIDGISHLQVQWETSARILAVSVQPSTWSQKAQESKSRR